MVLDTATATATTAEGESGGGDTGDVSPSFVHVTKALAVVVVPSDGNRSSSPLPSPPSSSSSLSSSSWFVAKHSGKHIAAPTTAVVAAEGLTDMDVVTEDEVLSSSDPGTITFTATATATPAAPAVAYPAAVTAVPVAVGCGRGGTFDGDGGVAVVGEGAVVPVVVVVGSSSGHSKTEPIGSVVAGKMSGGNRGTGETLPYCVTVTDYAGTARKGVLAAAEVMLRCTVYSRCIGLVRFGLSMYPIHGIVHTRCSKKFIGRCILCFIQCAIPY